MTADMASRLRSNLDLEDAPVALAFTDGPPNGVQVLQTPVPSACSLWRRGAEEVFYAPAESHYNCSIGAMTMGFPLPESVSTDLQETVTFMSSHGYLTEGEPAHIPMVSHPRSGIVYGPLHAFPIQPNLVLLWLSPIQAMLVAEAAGTVQWTAPTPTEVYGRPACTALPLALNGGQPTISFGCQGMRTYTAISGDRLLAVLPGADLDRFVEALSTTVEVNRTMRSFYDERHAALTQATANWNFGTTSRP
jgi:uncharacterized protein (DUF169 family)